MLQEGGIGEIRFKDIDLKEGYLPFEQTKNGGIRKVPVLGEAPDLLHNYSSQHSVFAREELFRSRIIS